LKYFCRLTNDPIGLIDSFLPIEPPRLCSGCEGAGYNSTYQTGEPSDQGS